MVLRRSCASSRTLFSSKRVAVIFYLEKQCMCAIAYGDNWGAGSEGLHRRSLLVGHLSMVFSLVLVKYPRSESLPCAVCVCVGGGGFPVGTSCNTSVYFPIHRTLWSPSQRRVVFLPSQKRQTSLTDLRFD